MSTLLVRPLLGKNITGGSLLSSTLHVSVQEPRIQAAAGSSTLTNPAKILEPVVGKITESAKAAQVSATPDSGSDLLLVERAQRGDSDAYRELVERYQRRAIAIAVGLLGNPEDARDLVQQAFLKAYRSLGSFRGQSSFYTWLYRILVNLSIDFSRKAYRRAEQGMDDANLLDTFAQRSSASPDDYLGHLDGPEQRVQRMELRKRLESALESLSSEHRTVIILREIEGLSYSEISDAVGCSKGTVMSRLHHARKRLQKALGDLKPMHNPRAAASDAEESDADDMDEPEDADRDEIHAAEQKE